MWNEFIAYTTAFLMVDASYAKLHTPTYTPLFKKLIAPSDSVFSIAPQIATALILAI